MKIALLIVSCMIGLASGVKCYDCFILPWNESCWHGVCEGCLVIDCEVGCAFITSNLSAISMAYKMCSVKDHCFEGPYNDPTVKDVRCRNCTTDLCNLDFHSMPKGEDLEKYLGYKLPLANKLRARSSMVEDGVRRTFISGFLVVFTLFFQVSMYFNLNLFKISYDSL